MIAYQVEEERRLAPPGSLVGEATRIPACQVNGTNDRAVHSFLIGAKIASCHAIANQVFRHDPGFPICGDAQLKQKVLSARNLFGA